MHTRITSESENKVYENFITAIVIVTVIIIIITPEFHVHTSLIQEGVQSFGPLRNVFGLETHPLTSCGAA